MKTRKVNFYCIILALFMFFSGVIVEKSPDCITAVCSSFESTDSYIESVYTPISDTQICTLDMLRVKTIGDIRKMSDRFISLRHRLTVSGSFLLVNVFLLQNACFLRMLDVTNRPISCKNEPVIHFIHNSDGKKRI